MILAKNQKGIEGVKGRRAFQMEKMTIVSGCWIFVSFFSLKNCGGQRSVNFPAAPAGLGVRGEREGCYCAAASPVCPEQGGELRMMQTHDFRFRHDPCQVLQALIQ